MNKKPSEVKPVALPFIVGGDGRIYINEALIAASTITKGNITAPARAAS